MDAIAGSSRKDAGIVILIPLYNDWLACRLLLKTLDDALKGEVEAARVLLVDDGSTQPAPVDFPGRLPWVLDRVDVLQLRRNLGHQRAIAIGLSYIWEHVPCETIVLMDSDGEDDPADVPRLLAKYADEAGRKIIFAERTRRSESWSFVLFYTLYKGMHRLLVGMGVRVGNFSAIPRGRLDSLIVVSELWNHYAAAVVKSRQPFETVPTQAGRSAGGPVEDGLRRAGGPRPQRDLGLRRHHRRPAAGGDPRPDRPDDRRARSSRSCSGWRPTCPSPAGRRARSGS